MFVIFASLLAAFVYFFQLKLFEKRWMHNLKTEARFSTGEVYAGEEAELSETIENDKLLPLPMVKLKLQLSRKLIFKETDNSSVSDFFNRTDIYSIKGRHRVKRTIRFLCKERGYYWFNGVDILGSDPFFSKEFVEKLDVSSDLYVYPKPYDPGIMEPVLNRINGEILTKRNVVEDPFEFRGIREYQTFDSLKNVNWKAFAKSEELMVNMHDYTAKRTIRVFLNLENPTVLRHDELMEISISIAVSCITRFCVMGIPVSVYANSSDILTGRPIYLEEGSGESFIRNANRSFARIDLSKEPLSFEEYFTGTLIAEAGDTYTIIISPYIRKEFQKTIGKLAEAGKDFIWLCPVEKETTLENDRYIGDRIVKIDAKEALYEVSLS